jgi:hypothetical protein
VLATHNSLGSFGVINTIGWWHQEVRKTVDVDFGQFKFHEAERSRLTLGHCYTLDVTRRTMPRYDGHLTLFTAGFTVSLSVVVGSYLSLYHTTDPRTDEHRWNRYMVNDLKDDIWRPVGVFRLQLVIYVFWYYVLSLWHATTCPSMFARSVTNFEFEFEFV